MKSNDLFFGMRSHGVVTRFALCAIFVVFFLTLFSVLTVSADEGFTGRWQSKRLARPGAPSPFAGNFDLHLSQIGKAVTGSYLNGEGRITGFVRGGALKFSWQDEFGVGTGTFFISKDAHTLIGSWTGRTAGLKPIGGTWSANRAGQVVVAPGGANAATEPAPKSSQKSLRARMRNFSGTFMTTTSNGGSFEMKLSWNGNDRVTGTFTGNGSNGTISGILFDNVLHFSWSQDGGKYKGSGKFVLADDGMSFSGTYGNNPQNPNDTSAGNWNGRRK